MLQELRKKAGLKQQEVADALNISQSTVAMWENGTNHPRSIVLPALARLYNCTIDDLIDAMTMDRGETQDDE